MEFAKDILAHLKGGSKLLDITSIGLSVLCIAHCLALPLVIASLPFIGDIAHTEWMHQGLVALAIPLTGWTIYRSQAWRKWNVVLFAVIGLTALTFAAFYEPARENEVFISIVGAVYVAMAHIINYMEHAYSHSHGVPHDCR
jgi:chromate transport protein ChrA